MPSQTTVKLWHIPMFMAAMFFPPFFLVIFADMAASMAGNAAGAINLDVDDRWWDVDEPLGGRW